MLKRLGDAIADGDRIYAVIKGSAINNDGALKGGFTAPSVVGQAKVVAEALGVAQVDPATISYIEAHGPAPRSAIRLKSQHSPRRSALVPGGIAAPSAR